MPEAGQRRRPSRGPERLKARQAAGFFIAQKRRRLRFSGRARAAGGRRKGWTVHPVRKLGGDPKAHKRGTEHGGALIIGGQRAGSRQGSRAQAGAAGGRGKRCTYRRTGAGSTRRRAFLLRKSAGACAFRGEHAQPEGGGKSGRCIRCGSSGENLKPTKGEPSTAGR